MTVLEVICKTVAIQNNSQWPCSLRPIPQLRPVGVRTSYIYFFLIFPGHRVLGPITNPCSGPPWLHPVTAVQPQLQAELSVERDTGCSTNVAP